jgi:ferric-dicitrate binding protein FerR (iron transport regulator)
MTKMSDEAKASRTLVALTELYAESVEPATSAELDRGLDALLARAASGRARRPALVRWSLVGATVALSMLVVLQVTSVVQKHLRAIEPATLAYRIDGGSVLEGGYLRESGHAGINVLFNEGSKVSLTSGTRGRLRTVDREGALVNIEHGTASFQVTPNNSRRWLIDVGPFLVTVKGTVFTVSWDPLREQFELMLRQGHVVVSGPVSAGEITLRTGQHLVVNLATAATVITEDKPEQESDSVAAPAPQSNTPPAVQPPGAGEKPALRSHAAMSVPSRTTKAADPLPWSDELARGHWDRILEDVDRIGVETTLSKASSKDLFALADAARYRRRPDLARAALLAERQRFPDSPRSLDGLFLLGRTEESREGGAVQALGWYDQYLARAVGGPFVGEALGRKMILTDKLQGSAQARPIAEDYLRRFPKGSYAGSARALIHAQ